MLIKIVTIQLGGRSGGFSERLVKFRRFSQRMERPKLKLFERGSEFFNFSVMSAGKTEILLKKWRGTA